MMSETFKVSSSMLSHPGSKRPNNEDFAIFFEPADPLVLQESGAVYIVADGVGGASEGERASRYAAERVLHEYYHHPEEEPGVRLKQAMQQASQEIFDYAEGGERYKRMATTLVAVAIRGGQFTVAHVGDSRAYLLRDGKTIQLTGDHSNVGELVAQGLMTEEEALHSKAKNRLTRSLGAEAEAIVDVQYDLPLQLGDRLLLCSDGLTRYALGQKIGELAAVGTPEEAAARLVDFANHSGGEDNVTVIVVSVGAGLMTGVGAGPARPEKEGDTAPRGRLPERVDWETISTQTSRRVAASHHYGRLNGLFPGGMKKYALPFTLVVMVLLAGGLLAALNFWKLSGGGSQVLVTTGMPAARSLQPVASHTPTLASAAAAGAETPIPTLTVPPVPAPLQTQTALADAQAESGLIPAGSWCVYTIQGNGPDTIREIIQTFAGVYAAEYADLVYAAESGAKWEAIWPDGLDKSIPPTETDGTIFYPQVAVSFVETIEGCTQNSGEIRPKPAD